MAGAVMLKIAYGYNVDPFHDDALVNMAGEAVTVFVQNALPFKWAVDMIPSCKCEPSQEHCLLVSTMRQLTIISEVLA
jgi:hypothetical protein